jgi:hypothetical protein
MSQPSGDVVKLTLATPSCVPRGDSTVLYEVPASVWFAA